MLADKQIKKTIEQFQVAKCRNCSRHKSSSKSFTKEDAKSSQKTNNGGNTNESSIKTIKLQNQVANHQV